MQGQEQCSRQKKQHVQKLGGQKEPGVCEQEEKHG